jgi:hypothetical protein
VIAITGSRPAMAQPSGTVDFENVEGGHLKLDKRRIVFPRRIWAFLPTTALIWSALSVFPALVARALAALQKIREVRLGPKAAVSAHC